MYVLSVALDCAWGSPSLALAGQERPCEFTEQLAGAQLLSFRVREKVGECEEQPLEARQDP